MKLSTWLRPLALAGVLSCAAPASTGSPPVPPGQATGAGAEPAPATGDAPVSANAEAILARAELAAYHGWIKYLMFRAEHAEARFGKGTERARQDRDALASWTARILADPHLLAGLRGVFEWAYLSPVDGSGQPFQLNVPTDYDPARPAPLSLYMHGYSGNHLEHATYMKDRRGGFELAVLGRARGGWYRALSEADVLHALDYVEAHWSIDADRVHLMGGSMGGGGTFWLGSRHPQRFASGRPVCGFASDVPLGNLLSFPLYATHSDDDWVAPVLHSRGPAARLRELGGSIVYDETTGYGHEVWNYEAGNQRAEAWSLEQKRKPSQSVERLLFTAIDGQATRAHWAEIAEWGPRPEPASFALDVRGKNQLALRATNVSRLTLRVAEAPIERSAALELSVGGARFSQRAPLPDTLTLVHQGGAWSFEAPAPSPPFRLHTPGGANQLYGGEPLLIVYGTSGGAELTAALQSAAAVASRSPNAAWQSPNGELGDDGVSHNQNLYGELKVKADVDVSADEIASHHLVLIGTAAQNALVARLADRLPVRHQDGQLRFSDGTKHPADDTALGLVHYNPLAPSRLIFWVASDSAAAYGADALVTRVLGTSATGADFALARVSEPVLLMTRSFDSRWGWLSREASPLLPPAAADPATFARLLAEAVRRATQADFALALANGERGPSYAPSLRLLDLTALFYYEPIAVMTLTGAELSQAEQALASRPEARFQPAPGRLDPQRSYRVAVTARQITPLVRATHLAPRQYTLTELELASALGRTGFILR